MQNLKNRDEAVVVFSGGQDSTTCLLWALKKYKKVYAVSFDYGQKHIKELECAKKIAEKFGVEHHILDMSLLNQLAPNSLTRSEMKVFAAPLQFIRTQISSVSPFLLQVTRVFNASFV